MHWLLSIYRIKDKLKENGCEIISYSIPVTTIVKNNDKGQGVCLVKDVSVVLWSCIISEML